MVKPYGYVVLKSKPKSERNLQPMPNLIPTVIESDNRGDRALDIYSKLLKERIIFIDADITDHTASIVCAQLLFLSYEDRTADIHLYINSPGGSVSAGLAIYDTMHIIKPDVSTICMGMAASMGAFLLAGGTKGKRYCLANSEVMIHQPLGGAKGQATEIRIAAEHILNTKSKLNHLLAQNTGQRITTIEKDTDRDNYMNAEQAKEYGIVDGILSY